MKHKILTILVLWSTFSVYTAQAQTVVDSEDFTAGTGWSLNQNRTGTSVAPENNWYINNNYTFSGVGGFGGFTLNNSPTGGGNYLHIGTGGEPAYISNNSVYNEAFSSRSFVTTGNSNVSLYFEWVADGGSNSTTDFGEVYYSINNGAWTKITGPVSGNFRGSGQTWQTFTASAASVSNVFDNQSDIKLKFVWQHASTLSGAGDPPFCIDQIQFRIPTVTPPSKVVGTLDSQTNLNCFGDSVGSATVSAVGTPGYSYQWKDDLNGAGNNIGTNSVTISNLKAGDYSVIISDAAPSKDTVNVTITQPTKLVLATNNKVDISCNGANDGSVNVTASGGTTAYQYSLNGINFITTSSFNDTLVTGNNEIWVKDSKGCRDSTIVNIVNPPFLVISTSNLKHITCNGFDNGSVDVGSTGGTGAVQFSLNNNTYITTTNFSDTLVLGNNKIWVKDTKGCLDSTTINVSEPPLLTLDTVSATPATCFYKADGIAELTLTSPGAGSGYQYSFNGGAFSSINVDSSLAGTVVAVVKDTNECVDTFTFVVGGASAINVSILEDSIRVCDGFEGTLNYSVNNAGILPYTYVWVGNSEFSNDDGSSVIVKPSSSYLISVQAFDSNGCPSNIDTTYIILNELPDISLDSTIEIIPGNSAELKVVSTNGVTFSWSPSLGLSSSTSNSVTASPTEDTKYQVIVETSNGCVDTAYIKVIIGEGFAIYTAFTPNNDGKNDTWVIEGISNFVNAEVEIINRWGGVVYEKQKDYALNPWNGKLKNVGKDVESGTYYYIIDKGNGEEPLTGALQLLK